MTFWVLSAAAGVAFVFLIVGHALAGAGGDGSEPGELPVWYQIEACQNTTGTITTTPTGEVTLCAKEVASCPTSWNMHVARKAPKDETETEPPMKEVDVNPASSSESESEDENSKAKAKTTAAKGKKGKANAKKTKKAAGKAAGGGKRSLRLRKKVRYEDDASLSGSDGEDGGKITTKATTKGVLKKRTRPSTPTTDPEDCSADEGGEKKPLLDSYAAATAGDSGVGYGSGGDWRVASVMDW